MMQRCLLQVLVTFHHHADFEFCGYANNGDTGANILPKYRFLRGILSGNRFGDNHKVSLIVKVLVRPTSHETGVRQACRGEYQEGDGDYFHGSLNSGEGFFDELPGRGLGAEGEGGAADGGLLFTVGGKPFAGIMVSA